MANSLPPITVAQNSQAQKRLGSFLKQYPEADTNKDGKLTREEVDSYRKQLKSAKVSAAKSAPKSLIERYTVDDMAEVYEALEFEGMPYRLMKPIEFTGGAKIKYPLILSLHGAGGKGTDNKKNLKVWNGVLAEESLRKKHPCFVVAPQSPVSWRAPNDVPEINKQMIDTFPEPWKKIIESRPNWIKEYPNGKLQLVFDLLDSLAKQYPIDLDRVYVLGHSMGGFGTFEAIAKQPARFAAAIPSAGGLSPWHDISSMKDIPIWAFHGDQDTTVPIGLTRVVYERMKELNGNMKFTELGGVRHNANAFAFIYKGDDMSDRFTTHLSSDKCDLTSDVWDWLFSQQRTQTKQ